MKLWRHTLGFCQWRWEDNRVRHLAVRSLGIRSNRTWRLILRWSVFSWENKSKKTKICHLDDWTLDECPLIKAELLWRIWFGGFGVLRSSKALGGKVNWAVGKVGQVWKREAGLVGCELEITVSLSKTKMKQMDPLLCSLNPSGSWDHVSVT